MLVAAAKRLGIPSVITLHGGDVYVNAKEGYDFPTRWYVRPVLERTLRAAQDELVHEALFGSRVARHGPSPFGCDRPSLAPSRGRCHSACP